MLCPLLLWLLTESAEPRGRRFYNNANLVNAGQVVGLVGMAMLSIAFVLSSRARFLEDYFGGLDKMYRVHHQLGQTAFVLLLVHPVAVFGALLGAELTTRQGVILRYLARLMMTAPNANIYTPMEFMDKPKSVRPHLEKLDRSARYFFETQFFSPEFDTTRRQILTRLWGVLSNSALERMLGNARNKVDLFEAMNNGSIILINTAKDLLKQEGCEILGRFQERASIPEGRRLPTFAYIDEAQGYFDESVEHLLNQARKYKVGLVIAHQNLDQFGQKLRASVMASTSIKMAGGLSAKDASREMCCDEAFLQERRKHQKHTEFACFIRNHMKHPTVLDVPFGLMEGKPRLGEKEQGALLAANRLRICGETREVRPLAGRRTGEASRRCCDGFANAAGPLTI